MKREGLSFAARLNAWFATVVILLSVALFLITYLWLYRAVQERNRESVGAQLEIYRAWYAEGGLPALRTRFLQQEGSGKETFFVRVLGGQGAALFASTPRDGGKLDLDQLGGLTPNEAFALVWSTLPANEESRGWLVATARLPDGSVLQVGKTTEALAVLLKQFRTIFAWAVLIALLLGLVGGAWLSRRTLAPIRQLIATVEKVIATGRMSERMPLRQSNDEIARLARLFNTMLEKNEMLIRRMREALDNVAHDLRTPLTRLRGVAELALQGEADVKTCRDALLDTMEESDRVLAMLNTLMDISEAETGLMKLDLEAFPLTNLVGEVVELFEFVAEENQIAVSATIPNSLQVVADRNRLRQVLVNLVDNAIKYTPRGGRVDLSAEGRGNDVALTVKDTGSGIPESEVPRIWERLYRGDKSRSQRGLGLGLSLVRAIISAHGGRIELESIVGKGSIFTIHLRGR